MIEESLKAPARVWRETFASLLDYDDSAEVARLDVSDARHVGDKDAIIDRAATEALARSIRNAKLVVYEGIGHTPHGRIQRGSRTTSRRSWRLAGHHHRGYNDRG